MNARLILENGTIIQGSSFGAEGESTGEIVFNTSLTGYQEILTDPSYCGQIVTMTYPLIGNYGVNPDDMEGTRSHVAGFVVKEYIGSYSNFRAEKSLDAWLKEHRIVAIQGIDTRMITRMIRTSGAMRAMITTSTEAEDRLLERVRSSRQMAGSDLTKEVTCSQPYEWKEGGPAQFRLEPLQKYTPGNGAEFHVVVYDYGVKRNILRRLKAYGCKLTVVPSDYPASGVLRMNPDGIFLSNGPGDPDAVKYAIANIRDLIGKKPIFGICLGHQLLALALGGKTYKLKFGHRGANHPVKNLRTGTIEITSQNHGFAVEPEAFTDRQIEITHVNLNDGTNEGFRHKELPLFCVQYHPEASPGPHDSDYLFHEFILSMKAHAPEHAAERRRVITPSSP